MTPEQSAIINDMFAYLRNSIQKESYEMLMRKYTHALHNANALEEKQRKNTASRAASRRIYISQIEAFNRNLQEKIAEVNARLGLEQGEVKRLKKEVDALQSEKTKKQRMMHLIERYTMDDPEWHPTERDARIYKSETTSYSSADSFPIE